MPKIRPDTTTAGDISTAVAAHNTTASSHDVAEVEITDSATLALTHAGKVLRANKATALTVTVPPNAGAGSVAFPIGTVIIVVQAGAGQVTIAPGAGVSLRSPGAALKTTAQYSQASLIKRGADEWYVHGGLST